MRPLTEEETKVLFEKLAKYIGKNLRHVVDRPGDPHVFRLHRDRVFYVRERLLKLAVRVPRDALVSLGVCIGKFTKSRKFRVHVTALDVLAQYAPYKVWVKPSSEMSFLYANNVAKSGLGRITESTPQYQGVVVLSMADTPLGFATTAKSTQECRKLDPVGLVAYHQGDVGEYLRTEGGFDT